MERLEKPDKFEGLDDERMAYLRELRDEIIGGDEGRAAAQFEHLAMLLSDEFEKMDVELFQSVCYIIDPDLPGTTEKILVADGLADPKDSNLRTNLIGYLLDQPDTREAVELLRDMERFLSKNA